MTTVQVALLEVLRGTVTDNCIQLPEAGLDYDALLGEAKMQAVALFLLQAAENTPLPNGGFERYQKYCAQVVAHNVKTAYAQKQLIQLLEENGIDYVILKGESSAAWYSSPQLRTLGDVDFLIDPKLRDKVAALLTENGYVQGGEACEHHYGFRKGAAHLEMHWQVSGIPNGKAGEKAQAYLQDCLKQRVIYSGENGSFYVPCAKHHGMILLLHMQQHLLGEGLGLRHLYDWAAFVNATAQEPFWQDDLLPLLKEVGLLTFASTVTAVASLYLGTACPNWAQAPQQLCELLMEDFLAGGNFGSKDKIRAQSAQLISNRGKDGTTKSKTWYLCRVLHEAVKLEHPIVNKVPILYPVFYSYRIIRRLALQLRGKRASFGRLIPIANTRRELYSQLHLFEVEKDGK